MRRKTVSPSKARAQFTRTANSTKSINIRKPTVVRGGFRL